MTAENLGAAAQQAIAFVTRAGCEHLCTADELVSDIESFVEAVRGEGEDEAFNLVLFDGSSPGWFVVMVLRQKTIELSFHVVDSDYPREVAHWIEGEGEELPLEELLDGTAAKWGKPFLRCVVPA